MGGGSEIRVEPMEAKTGLPSLYLRLVREGDAEELSLSKIEFKRGVATENYPRHFIDRTMLKLSVRVLNRVGPCLLSWVRRQQS
jgi:hypothetical protein